MRGGRVGGIYSSSVASSAVTEGSETPNILYEGMHGISTSLTLLEHVNLNIPEHKFAIPFYLDILGFGLDPRRAQNVVKGSGTVWYEIYSFSLDLTLLCDQSFMGCNFPQNLQFLFFSVVFPTLRFPIFNFSLYRVNCGPSQFHLPSADTPQIIPGSVGLS
jgi:hypothetical protein